MKKYNWYKVARNFGLACFVISPILGWLYVESKMKVMEKGIHDDLARIKSKGKTLADIPRKIDWMMLTVNRNCCQFIIEKKYKSVDLNPMWHFGVIRGWKVAKCSL